MLAKNKIIGIVLAIIFCVSAVTCGIVFGVSKSLPQTGASTNTSRLFSTNLFKDGDTVNTTNALALINAVGGLNATGVKKWSALKNGSNPIIFPMGTVPGTSTALEWEVVHRDGDIITVWLNQNYTMEYFNSSGKTYSSGIFAGATKTNYSQLGNYSRSTLRQATQQIYTNLIASSYYPILDSIVVSPQTAESIEGYIDYQASQGNTKFYYTDGSYTSITNGLSTQTSTTNPYSWTWDSTVYNDKFWIPSYYEVFNKGNGVAGSSNSGTNYFDGGYWGFSAYSDLGFSTSTLLNSGVTANYCWLRSGISNSSGRAMMVGNSGSSNTVNVYGTNGVRPAAHLSLSSMYDNIEWVVSFNSNGGSDCASINVLNKTSYGTLPTPTKTGYTFAGWYKNSDLSGSPVSTSDIVTANHTLYAKWNEISFYVTGSSTAINDYEYQHLDSKYITLYINPQTGHYISEISFDNSTFYPIECSVGYIDNSPVAVNISYGANINTNMLVIELKGIIQSYLNNNGGIHIYIKTTTTPYTELKSSNGANIEGISVTSTKGGTAYIVGDDFDNLTDTDTITFATKPCLSGYDFSHWQDMNGNNLGTEMSIRLQKSQVMDNIITAVYVQSSSNVNDNLNN